MKNNFLQQLLDDYQLSYNIVAGFLGVDKKYVQGLATNIIKTEDIKIVKKLGLLFDLDQDGFDELLSSIYSKHELRNTNLLTKTR